MTDERRKAATDDAWEGDFQRLGDLLADAMGLHDAAGLHSVGESRGGACVPEPSADRSGPRSSLSPRCRSSRRGSPLTQRVAAVWRKAVGEEIAAHALPRQLRNGRLVVATASPAWAQSLQFMAEDIRSRLNDLLGEEAVLTMFFRHASWDDVSVSASTPSDRPKSEMRSTETPTVPGPLPQSRDDGRRAALDAVRDLGLSADLTKAITRAMEASFAWDTENSPGREIGRGEK